MKAHHYRVAVIAAGIITMGYGMLDDGRIDSADIRAIAILIILAGLGSLAHARAHRPTRAAYELGHGDGFAAGYEEGRRVGRPTVVQLSARIEPAERSMIGARELR